MSIILPTPIVIISNHTSCEVINSFFSLHVTNNFYLYFDTELITNNDNVTVEKLALLFNDVFVK